VSEATEKKAKGAAKKAPARKAATKSKAAEQVPQLELHNLHPPAGAVKNHRRRGQGEGSGRGRTAGRGHKGQRSRSGYSGKRGFEGGQMPLSRRLPKRGFTNIFRTELAEINVGRLELLAGEKEITPELLKERGLIKNLRDGVKVLGVGELKSKLKVRAHAFSASARQKIEAAGGVAEVIEK
jgi:large subunit ribosomal protein L15